MAIWKQIAISFSTLHSKFIHQVLTTASQFHACPVLAATD